MPLCQLSFPYIKVLKKQPAIIERMMEPLPTEQPKAAAAAAGANGSPISNGTPQQPAGAEQKPSQEQRLNTP
jgi:hypothetical protein